jgi:rhomboid protease GluP
LAECRQCGAQLPTFTLGSASEYCKNCRAQQRSPSVPDSAGNIPAPAKTEKQHWLGATTVMISINVVVFVAMVAAGVSVTDPTSDQLLHWGANYGPYTLGGQYWRAISSAFLHIGIFHLAMNMWCLWSLGRLLEKFLGPFVAVAVYLLTAIGATLLSLTWDPIRVGAGASGAIFGITGVLITFLYFGKLNLPPENVRKLLGYVVRFAGINLIYGLTAHIDNMAHLGGLVTGLLIGIFLARTVALPSEDRSSAQRYIFLAAAVCLVLLFITVTKTKSYAVELGKGITAVDDKQYESATEHLRKYVAARPDDAYGHMLLGYSYHSSKLCDQAAEEYRRALALEPGVAWTQANLASIYVCQGKFPEALDLYKTALPKIQPNAATYLCYATALNATHAFEPAEAAARKSINLDPKDPATHRLLATILQAEDKSKEAQQETAQADALERSGPKPASR